MECPSCQATVPEGGKFCMECGSPLPRRCPACGHSVLAAAKFCPECGASLTGDVAEPRSSKATTATKQLAPAPVSSAERRQLTVMFCDLVGSTALSARLDPEDMREVIAAYHKCVADVVGRFEGFIARYMGDGVLIYFGWPRAHEDEAERAVRAGLAIVDALAGPETPAREPLAARVGIATGLVMVGELIGAGVAQEQTVVGETPNLAARLQALAAPGSVVISQATRRLVGGLFELVDLGSLRLKGFTEPVTAWRVEGEGRAEGRFEALHGERLTPLVGREHELGILLERWAWAKDGDGQVVLLSGEPGIGKSRLIRALRESLGDEPYMPLSHYCSPYHTNSTLHPVLGLLERATRLDRDDPPEAQLAKLEAVLGRSSDRLDEVVPLLAALLGVPTGERYPALTLTPEVQKRRTLQALVDQLVGLAAQQPVLALYEDVHWIDPSTLELLGMVVERIQRLPVLVLITFRPEFQPPWNGQAHVTTLTMSRLGRRQGAELVARVTDDKPLPAEIVEQIVARTDGVPLFVEELTKTVLESGLLADAGDHYELKDPLPPLAIPTTLHDSLMARLDRLAPVKEVAQIGAVIGREFSRELLAAVAPISANLLDDALEQLVTSELVFRRGTASEVTYSFKHALVQDTAYQSLLKSKRQQLHARIAKMLEERFPEVVVTQPELLAHHCAEGGLAERAVDYWLAAGERALRASANVEGTKHLLQGLEVLKSLPDTPERQRKELRFQTALGLAFTATKGWTAPEVAQAYSRADKLCQALSDSGERFKALLGLWNFHAGRGENHRARELSDELFRLAEQQDDDELRLQAHHSVWGNITWLGEFTVSREHTEQGIAMYSPARHRSHAFTYGGHDPGVCGWVHGGVDLWFLGYPDQAAEHVYQSVLLAEEIAHPPTMGHALHFGLLCHQLRRDVATVRAWGDRLAALAAEYGLALYEATAIAARGWVLANQGQAKSSLVELRRGLDGYTAMRFREFEPYFKASLAEAHLDAGEAAIGLEVLEDAMHFAFAEESGVRFWNAELLRLKGKLLAHLLPDDGRREVEAYYREALAVARRQQARSLELRAATSLARLWCDQGKRSEARDLLAPVYDWFTEGFDTPDLKDAKALLDKLSK